MPATASVARAIRVKNTHQEAIVTRKPDYSTIALQADGHEKDSFSLAVQAAMKLLGKDLDYETVAAFSSNVFAPCLCTGESCKAWWGMYGRGRCIPLVGQALGLKFRKLELPEFEGEMSEQRLIEYDRACAPIVRQAMEGGEIVLPEGGWQVKGGPYGFVPWCWWGIITDVRADGSMVGATLNGKLDVPIRGLYQSWAVSPAEATVSSHDADVLALLNAIGRIRADREPFDPFRPGDKYAFGIDAMDLWAEQMGKVPFCPDCKDKSWTCANDNARMIAANSRVAASWLRRRAPGFPERARPSFLAAAERYERIAELMQPFTTYEQGKGYHALMGGLAKQQEHAALIRQCKGGLEAVAEDLTAAIACAYPIAPQTSIGGRLTVNATATSAIPFLTPGLPGLNPYYGAGVPVAYSVALNHMGTRTTFAEFTALSGWAFSFGYRYAGHFPAAMAIRGNPAEDGPYEVFAFAARALGYDYAAQRAADREAAWAFIRKHVDAGTPVLSEHMDGGLICGYREGDGVQQVLFMSGGPDGGTWLDIARVEGITELAVLVKAREPMPREQMYREALQRAVRLASPHDWKGVPQGLAALDAYLADVADPAKDFENAGPWFCWAAFERLTARSCCARWLWQAAHVLGGDAKKPLQAAARHYEKATEFYERYRAESGSGIDDDRTLREKARTPEKISLLVPILKAAIAEERAGIEQMRRADELLTN